MILLDTHIWGNWILLGRDALKPMIAAAVTVHLPLWKRGIEGDLFKKISPTPSFSKRRTEQLPSAIEHVAKVVVSSISFFVATLLVKKRKLELPLSTGDWIREALEQSGIECLSITCPIAHRAIGLTDIHRDPADRIIIATTLEHGARLASYDTAFPSYPELSGHLLTGQSA